VSVPLADALVAQLDRAGLETAARVSDRLAAAHDASHYLLVPRAVVRARRLEDVVRAFETARRAGAGVTFRSGGTSLSGQAGGDGVLVDTRRHFRDIEVLDDGARVRCGPGVTVRQVNARLARYGRKLGPDPASEIACTIGGVVANNSSGMACGIEQNTYRTLESMVLVLPSGTVVDTSAPDADARLRAAEPVLHRGLERLRDRVRADPASLAAIHDLYAIKNTMGYGVNSFADHETPADILQHLVIGSEGTLAFVAEATFRTVPLRTELATALLVFDDLGAATTALPDLVRAGFATVELLDATSLRVAQRDPEAPADLAGLQVRDHAALLVELQEESAGVLAARVDAVGPVIDALPLSAPSRLSSDPARRAALWHIRKGLFTLVAGARPSGTTALLEDIAVPVERLYATCIALTALFARHGYRDAVIFGHARDGNIHFMLTERFDDPASLTRYEAFTEDMVDLVLAQGGTLKAEHGTGRIMAPFVRRQFGDELYAVMREVKQLADPDGLLNPGVLLTDEPDGHLRFLKSPPRVEEEVDRCVECGYCEPVCPSRSLTLTPRERIVLRRELQQAVDAGDAGLAATLREEYRYDGVETCAADGMCQTACPVLIDTGDLVRRLRAEDQGRAAQAGWTAAAKGWAAATRLGGIALSIADRVPSVLPNALTEAGRAILGDDVVPRYTGDLPAGGGPRIRRADPDPVAVYFPSCTTTMFGPAGGGPGVAESFARLAERAGVALVTPEGIPSLCCGTPWKSKGLGDGYAVMQREVLAALREATRDGELPVVCDASSCTEGLVALLRTAAETDIRVVDAVAFVAETVLPHLPAGERLESLTLHPTCSSVRLGIDDQLTMVAGAVAERVVIPDDWGCCAFAGDRGMLHPELTASATGPEAAAVLAARSSAHASVNRTCELGMTRATGLAYRHLLELLDEVTAG
jgi:D-lactate dehydrogenase